MIGASSIAEVQARIVAAIMLFPIFITLLLIKDRERVRLL